ncbi:glutamate 5-kinase [Rhinocladiella mackenziei CBS 650.93]|uniref:Glutamate 5-kinase n=1 Tax=Rhinocladiella mackenziei CBS 650.93 TaxID=1442369 RepID=A0A0D2JCE3_9EURO|nr:glutamate 5-kinase [Rhinocladiella mackenziei CBS 650.93]KIX06780.1 glutamate 5-kinase [Rhinocladiella mackenziei CBS 650.93]
MKPGKHLTVVIKIGTSSIVDERTHEPILSILSLIVETAIKLRRDGHRVVIVSSGAVGVGLQRMNMPKRPKHLAQVQALAAIGQSRLMSIWDSLFAHMNQPVAQILITRNDIADRSQYLNAQNTLAETLSLGVIPIVNENDTLAVSEIKFGDNDTLSAIASAMVHADYLFLMTDVDCLYDKNPRQFSDASPILVVDDIDALQVDVSSAGSTLGTGGMATKIVAARLATAAGTSTIITKSSKPGNVASIIRHLHPPIDAETGAVITDPVPPLHTRFIPSSTPIRNRAFWILHGLAPHGTIYIDRGASNALANKAGLLPVGVVGVEGTFAQQEAVRLVVVDKQPLGSLSPTGDSGFVAMQLVLRGEEIGRAVVNYSSAEVARIKGLRSAEIMGILGYADSEYVAFRENVSLHTTERSRPETPSGFRTPTTNATPEHSIVDLRAGQ